MDDKTMTFSLGSDREREIREILITVYGALKEPDRRLHPVGGSYLHHNPQQRAQPDPENRPRSAAANSGQILSDPLTCKERSAVNG